MLATSREVAQSLRVNPATVHRMMKDGRISQNRFCKIGHVWRFDLLGIEADLLSKHYEPPKNP